MDAAAAVAGGGVVYAATEEEAGMESDDLAAAKAGMGIAIAIAIAGAADNLLLGHRVQEIGRGILGAAVVGG